MKRIGEQRWLWPLLLLLFFLSGLSSLIYQVLWMRTLVLVFGGTTLATSTVLAVFMSGLALGSFLCSRFISRVGAPFLWYGLLEGGIGLWALLAPVMFAMATPIYQTAWQQFDSNPLALNIVRLLVASVILLPPTTCMGATLPLLAQMITTKLESIGDRVGLLYSINTFGAVVGTVLAGFVLLPNLGLQVSTFVSAAINLLLCLVVVVANRKSAVDSGAVPFSAVADPLVLDKKTSRLEPSVLVTIALFGLCGAVSMVYEVAWTRALVLVIGSSTYAFSVMVAAFLIGIVGGSFICSRIIDKQADTMSVLAMLELFAGLMALIGIVAFSQLPYWNLLLNANSGNQSWFIIAVRFILSGLILMPLTFVIGATFPAAVKSCTKQLEQVGRSVGVIYCANTIGAIFGALICGFLLIPHLGTETTLVIAALVNIAIGFAFLWMVDSVRRPIKVISGVFVIVLFAFSPGLPQFWDQTMLVMAQTSRRDLAHGRKIDLSSYDAWIKSLHDQWEIIFYKDGQSANVAIEKDKASGQVFLITNGHIDASDGVDMVVQQLLAYMPLACHKNPKDVAVVGWGSGVTVGAAAQLPVEKIDAIELEPAVVEAAQSFNHVNHRPDTDRRVTIIGNDGRNHILATSKKYDAILSEPSNPWQAGVCNLFTAEYFQICKSKLKDDGILALWLQITEVAPENVRQICSALTSVFPNTLTFSPDQGNVIIVASASPIEISWERLKAVCNSGSVKKDLDLLSMGSAEDILSRAVTSANGMRALSAGAPANTDDRNRVEYEVARTYESSTVHRKDNNQLFRQNVGDVVNHVDWGTTGDKARAEIMARVSRQAYLNDDQEAAGTWLKASQGLAQTSEGAVTAALIQAKRGDEIAVEKNFSEALRLSSNDPVVLKARGQHYISTEQRDKAVADFEAALAKASADAEVRLALARLYSPQFLGLTKVDPYSEAQAKKVLAVLSPVLEDQKFVSKNPISLMFAAEAECRLQNWTVASGYLSRYAALHGLSIPAARLYAAVAAGLGDSVTSNTWWQRSLAAARAPSGAPSMVAQGKEMLAKNKPAIAARYLRAALDYDPTNAEAQKLLKTN